MSPMSLRWRVRPGKREVELGWVPAAKEEGVAQLTGSVVSCLQARFARLTLPATWQGEEDEDEDGEASGDMMGVVHFAARPAYAEEAEAQAQATTRVGYELMVSAQVEGKDTGSTKLFLPPTQIPAQRLRANARARARGRRGALELLRGPGFNGALPEKLFMDAGPKRLESKVDKASRAASFRLPADFEGWAEVQWGTAIARVYVAPRAQLALEVSPEKPAYAPGELARLQVRTRVDGKDGPAAVGLFGVDEGMAQLAPLPGPTALSNLRPAPTVSNPAFGVLDAQALPWGAFAAPTRRRRPCCA